MLREQEPLRRNNWKTIVAVLLISAVFPSMVWAENRTAKEYMTEGIRAAYHNMHLVYQGFYDDEGNLEEQPGGYVALFQEWDEKWNLFSRTYLDPNGKLINRTEGYANVEFKISDNGIRTIRFYDADGGNTSGAHVFLLTELRAENDGWSEWMAPIYDTENSTITIGYADLGDKEPGDKYICKVEVEFSGVDVTYGQKFWFGAQGQVDGMWDIGNIWNGNLISLHVTPKDDVYTCCTVNMIDENNASGNTYYLGFRCDNWRSGKFRIRNISIEKAVD